VVSALVVWRIVHSPFGRTLLAIRFNETRTQCIGYNTNVYKWAAFTVSCVFASLAGTLFALLRNAAFSDTLHHSQSGNVVMMVLLGGGMGNFFGPILGTGVFIVLRDMFSAFTEHWYMAYGLLFMFVIIFLPEGILGFLQREKSSKELASSKR